MRIFIILITLIALLSAEDRVVLRLSKTKAFLNEPIVAKVTIINEKKAKYITLKPFKNRAIYSKLISESNQTLKGDNYYKTFTYILFPQATGTINIAPRVAKVSTIQEKTGFTISKDLKSKSAKIDVYSLPSNLTISGNLNMHLKKLTNKIVANTPANFRLEIRGKANLDDIKAFSLAVKNITYFSDKPVREYRVVDGKVEAKFVQNFTVISDKSYKIPPLKLTYYNTQTRLEESLLTKEQIVNIPKPIATMRELIYLIVGLILGVIVSMLLIFRKKERPTNLHLAIKKAKNDKELYQILLPYTHNPELKETIEKLEANIYEGKKNRINKKYILKVL